MYLSGNARRIPYIYRYVIRRSIDNIDVGNWFLKMSGHVNMLDGHLSSWESIDGSIKLKWSYDMMTSPIAFKNQNLTPISLIDLKMTSKWQD